MFSKEVFGLRLREIRKEKKETQDDLARLLDVGKSHISEMERGNRTTTAEKIALISPAGGNSENLSAKLDY